jgi:hypothetical protein
VLQDEPLPFGSFRFFGDRIGVCHFDRHLRRPGALAITQPEPRPAVRAV